jgi:undecaprenol kinase/diacylglycerol kinase (ATP)
MAHKTGNMFINAFEGLAYFFRHERNGRIQSVIAIFTMALAAFFHIGSMEWIIVLICTGSVLSLEMLNSALEKLCDFVHPGLDARIKIIKDMAAGAVLWASIISAAIGTIIFLPKILNYL